MTDYAKKFETQRKACERLIEKLANDEAEPAAVYKAVGKLDDISNKMLGDPENPRRFDIANELRHRTTAAIETGRTVRQKARSEEIARLTLEARQQSHARDRAGGFDVHGVGYGDKYRVRKG